MTDRPPPPVVYAEGAVQAIKCIQAAEEHLNTAAGAQSLLRIHEQIIRAERQLEVAKALLRQTGQSPIT